MLTGTRESKWYQQRRPGLPKLSELVFGTFTVNICPTLRREGGKRERESRGKREEEKKRGKGRRNVCDNRANSKYFLLYEFLPLVENHIISSLTLVLIKMDFRF